MTLTPTDLHSSAAHALLDIIDWIKAPDIYYVLGRKTVSAIFQEIISSLIVSQESICPFCSA